MKLEHWLAPLTKECAYPDELVTWDKVCCHAAQMGVKYLMYLDEYDHVLFCSEGLLKRIGLKKTKEALTLNIIYSRIGNIKEIEKVWNYLDSHDEYNGILTLSLKTGEKLWAGISVKKHRKDGNHVGSTVYFIDITSEYNKRELKEVLRIRDDMLMAISHELRTPLNAIYGSVELLALSENLNENERTYISNIREGIKALQASVENIDDYMVSKKQNIKVVPVEFTIYNLLDEIRTVVYMKALQKGLNFFIRLAPDIPKKLTGDLEKISTVLLQLLYNGIEYTKEGLVGLSISCYEEDKTTYIRYEVADTGVGIREEHQAILFHALARFVETDQKKISGMGLGLTVCQEYIKAMGGEIKCESSYGQGSRFYFVLAAKAADTEPIARVLDPEAIKVLMVTEKKWRQGILRDMCDSLHIKNIMAADEIKDAEEEYFTHIIIDSDAKNGMQWLEKELPYVCERVLILASGRKFIDNMALADRIFYEPFTVNMLSDLFNKWNGVAKHEDGQEDMFQTKNVRALVVDDNQVNLMVAANILKQYNIQVDEAQSGTMAIQMYYNNEYDIILMDYLMPDMNGVEVTKSIRRLNRPHSNTAIIALSANVTEEITRLFTGAGANGIMSKPLEIKELGRQLKKWLPPHKFVKETDIAKEQEEDLEKICRDALKIALGNIKELDWQRAMEGMRGSVKSYIKVLKVVCGNIAEQAACIRGAENLLKIWDLRIYYHSLRGILLNIGAKSLAIESEKLENAAKNLDKDYIQAHQGLYLEKLDELIEGLKEALSLYQDILSSSTVQEESEISSEEFAKKIEILKGYIERFEFNEINTALEELISASKGENKKILEETLEEIQKFDYSEAMEKLNQLKEF